MTLQFFHNQTTITADEQTFNERAYLTAPVAMLAVGVLNDIYVPAEEAGKFPEAWNGRPVTLNHPQRNGQYVSANTPEIAAWETPGQVWGVSFQSNKLQGQLWIDVEKAESIGGDALTVMERLRKGEAVEVSTGYFAEVEAKSGTYNGKKYTGIAHNLRPDHLALLPNSVGACNWQDGCGTPRVNELQGNCGCRKGKAMPKEQEAPTGNEKELGDRYSLIRRALRAHTGQDEYDDFDSVAVFDEYVIAKSWQTKEAMAYPYTMAEDGAVSFGPPLPVDVVYRSKADGAELVTANQQAQRVAEQNFVSAFVQQLLTAAGRGKQTTAEAGKDSEMEKGTEQKVQETPAVAPVVNVEKPQEQPAADNAVLVNLAAQLEKLAQRLDGIDAKLTANADKERQELVKTLAANERCPFDEAELQALSVAHLQKLAVAYQPADYSGGAGVVANRGEQYESLAMPAWVVAAGKEG